MNMHWQAIGKYWNQTANEFSTTTCLSLTS